MIHSYLYFAGEERLRVIRSEHDCLKRLNRDTKRFKRKAQLNSYVGLAPHLVGSGQNEEVKSGGNRKKKQLHYQLIESDWRAVRFNREYGAKYGGYDRERNLSAESNLVHREEIAAVDPCRLASEQGISGSLPKKSELIGL